MQIKGLRDIAQNYDAMLIDQFGVIHDGQKLYPGTAEVLANLYGMKIPVCVMTNSGKRVLSNQERLVKMGVPRAHFKDAMSSGEVAYHRLGNTRCFLIGKQDEDYGFTGVNFVDQLGDAEVILILGSDAPRTTLAHYSDLFSKTTLPAICCNPDKHMLTAHGLQPAPGAIAQLYADMGGAVTWYGKPYPEIYHQALKLLGNPQKVLCVGDSAAHDVAGGKAAGLSTLLVMAGISMGLDSALVQPQPDYVLQDFVW